MGKGFSLEGHLGSNQFFIHSNLKPDPIRHKKKHLFGFRSTRKDAERGFRDLVKRVDLGNLRYDL